MTKGVRCNEKTVDRRSIGEIHSRRPSSQTIHRHYTLQRNLFLTVTVAGITDLAGGPSFTRSIIFRHSTQKTSSTTHPSDSKLNRHGFQGSILPPHSKQNFGNIGLLLFNRFFENKQQCLPYTPGLRMSSINKRKTKSVKCKTTTQNLKQQPRLFLFLILR